MYVLDRFEEDLAIFVSKDGDIRALPRESFRDAREGDIFDLSADGSFVYNEELTKARRESVKSRFSRLVRRK